MAQMGGAGAENGTHGRGCWVNRNKRTGPATSIDIIIHHDHRSTPYHHVLVCGVSCKVESTVAGCGAPASGGGGSGDALVFDDGEREPRKFLCTGRNRMIGFERLPAPLAAAVSTEFRMACCTLPCIHSSERCSCSQADHCVSHCWFTILEAVAISSGTKRGRVGDAGAVLSDTELRLLASAFLLVESALLPESFLLPRFLDLGCGLWEYLGCGLWEYLGCGLCWGYGAG